MRNELIVKETSFLNNEINKIKTRKNDIVEYLDYQIPVTQLNGDIRAAKRD